MPLPAETRGVAALGSGMVWRKKDLDAPLVKEIAARYSVDLLTSSVLVRRGVVAPEEILYFLNSDLSSLHNPFLFDGMEDAVDRILEAVDSEERVFVFGDRDVDGITSTVLLHSALTAIGLDAGWSLPGGDDPYGLTLKTVERLAGEKVGLLITVDCGISNAKEIEAAVSLGIDVIVVDHHNPPERLPPAVAIINPKIAGCGYPFRDLAGCGVVSKVIWSLLFAGTELYKHSVCLLAVRPGNDTYVVDAVRLRNLAEEARISENLVPGLTRIGQTRLLPFLSGSEIVAYDAQAVRKSLSALFGDGVEFELADIAPEIARQFPSFAGKSLLRIRESGLLGRYRTQPAAEIDILKELYGNLALARLPNLEGRYRALLDLVALGTLADLMPLRNENRILVRQGMDVLNATARKGLQELLASQNLAGRRLNTTDIGWHLSPVINSTGRMGVPDKAAELLLTEDAARRRELVETVTGLNRERKRLGDSAWERILPLARKSYDTLDRKLVLVADREMHRGITGIIASRLTNFFHAPAVAVAFVADKAVGSMRSASGVNVSSFLERCAELFIDFGGHDFAAGFSMVAERYDEFVRKVPTLVEEMESAPVVEPGIDIDAELPRAFMNPELGALVERFEPYGEGNPPLVFLARSVLVASLDLVGKREQSHVKMLIDSGDFKWPAVYWNAADRAGKDFAAGDRVDIVFRLGRNYFQNRENLQLTILDVKR